MKGKGSADSPTSASAAKGQKGGKNRRKDDYWDQDFEKDIELITNNKTPAANGMIWLFS
jgi:hypothetical protein